MLERTQGGESIIVGLRCWPQSVAKVGVASSGPERQGKCRKIWPLLNETDALLNGNPCERTRKETLAVPISILCPSCRSKFTTPDKAVRKKTKCPICDHPFIIPSPRPAANQSALPPRAGVNVEQLATDLLSEQEADIPAPQQSAAQSHSPSRNRWGLEDGQTKPDEGGQQKARDILAALADDETAAKQESAKPRQYYPSHLPLRDTDYGGRLLVEEQEIEPWCFRATIFCADVGFFLGLVAFGMGILVAFVAVANSSGNSGGAIGLLWMSVLSAIFSFPLLLAWRSLLWLAVDVARKVRSMDRRIREFLER